MLRMQLGDEAFFKGVRNYYLAHRESSASSEDLRKELEAASGKNLREFFARWVYGAGHPRYELRWELSGRRRAAGPLKIILTQVQPGTAFLDPVPIEVVVDGRKIQGIVRPRSKFATLLVPITGQPESVELDPQGTLLKEVTKP